MVGSTRYKTYGGYDASKYEVRQPEKPSSKAGAMLNGAFRLVQNLTQATGQAMYAGGSLLASASIYHLLNRMNDQKDVMLQKGLECGAYTTVINNFFRDKPVPLTSGNSVFEYAYPSTYIQYVKNVLDIPASNEIFSSLTAKNLENEQFIESMMLKFEESGFISAAKKASEKKAETVSFLKQALYAPVVFHKHLLEKGLDSSTSAKCMRFVAAYKNYRGSFEKLCAVLLIAGTVAGAIHLYKKATAEKKES